MRAGVVVMLGGMDGGPLERLLRRALEASALDTLEAALATGRFDCALLLCDVAPTLPAPMGVTVEVDTQAGVSGGVPFQYGARLLDAVQRHAIDALLYCGAGSAPLLDGAALEGFVAPLLPADAAGGGVCVTNNRFSADLFAFAPASLLARLDPSPANDNAVPRRLRDEHGVEVSEPPRTLETQYNLDSPADLIALGLSGRAHPRLTAVIEEAALDIERVQRASRVLIERTAEVLVAGRVSSRTWQDLESEAACRVRLLAEERGMQAAGTDADGTARSLLGQWIAEAGAERAFGTLLPDLCDAAFIDIRPALVHLGIRPSRADRFAADLGRADVIEDPRLRAIVEAANASPVLVVLGGHSLVGSALPLLNQWAWDEHDGLR
ncbi:MAG: hypothetical protein DWI58_20385 [Chloroflexi bacterium]|nr:MAG: hypothetical protein DWI58_20385 [Chloroflexota bacterium]